MKLKLALLIGLGLASTQLFALQGNVYGFNSGESTALNIPANSTGVATPSEQPAPNPTTCADVAGASGITTIYPDGVTPSDVHCDGEWQLITLITRNTPANQLPNFSSFPDTLPVDVDTATVSYMYKNSLSNLAGQVREGVSCSSQTNCAWVYGSNMTEVELDYIRNLMPANGNIGKPFQDRPSCTLSINNFNAGINDRPRCTSNNLSGTTSDFPSVAGWQIDAPNLSYCWAMRGNYNSGASGSSRCGTGEPIGSRFAQLWMR